MNRITELSKKRKITVLLCMLVAVCGLSVGALYVTGVIPAQTKGVIEPIPEAPLIGCHNARCGCHESWECGKCERCFY